MLEIIKELEHPSHIYKLPHIQHVGSHSYPNLLKTIPQQLNFKREKNARVPFSNKSHTIIIRRIIKQLTRQCNGDKKHILLYILHIIIN